MAFLRTMALGAVISVDLTNASMSNLAQLTRGLNQAENGLNGLVRGASRMGGAVMAQVAVAGAVAAGTLALAANEAARFEHAMQGVLSVGELTGQEYDAVRQKALTMVSSFAPDELVKGMEDMRRAGFSVAQTIEGISTMANVAAADQMSLAKATDIVGNTFRAFDKGDGVLTLERVGDVLAKASAETNTTIGDLGIAMAYIGPVARQLNIPIEDLVATVSQLSNVSLKGSKVGRGVASVLQSFAAPTDKARQKMAELGVGIAQFEDGSVDLIGTAKILGNALNKMTDPVARLEAAKIIVGKDQAKVFLAMADGALRADLSSGMLRDTLMGAAGEAERMARTRLDSFIGQMTILKNRAKAFAITLFEEVMPTLKLFAQNTSAILSEIILGMGGEGDSLFSFFGRGMVQAIRDINNALQNLHRIGSAIVQDVLEPIGPSATMAAFGIGYLSVALTVLLAVSSPFLAVMAIALFMFSGLGEIALVLAGVLGITLVGALALMTGLFFTVQASGMGVIAMLSSWTAHGKVLFGSFLKGLTDVVGPLEERFVPALSLLKLAFDQIVAAFKFAGGAMAGIMNEGNLELMGRMVGWVIRIGSAFTELGAILILIGAMFVRFILVPFATVVSGIAIGLMILISTVVDFMFTMVDKMMGNGVIAWGVQKLGLTWDKPDFGATVEDFKARMKLMMDDAMEQKGDKDANTATGGGEQPPQEIIDNRCIHVKSDLHVDGKKLAIAQKEVEVELTERAGFSQTPWQKRAILEHGAQPTTR